VILLSKKIRLQLSADDAQALEFMQSKCRGLYNWWVMRLRGGERWPGWSTAKATLQESKEYDPELGLVYGKLLHEVYFRLDRAMRAFFRRVQAGEIPGFPRVRPRHAFFTLCYPAIYVKVEGVHLLLPTGGGGKSGVSKRFPTIDATLTEAAPDTFREVAISRDARGHYFASFVTEVTEECCPKDGVVAFDLGIKTLATGVNDWGKFYHIGGFRGTRWYNKQLDKIRAKRARCQKKSNRYIFLSGVYRRVSEQKRHKQRDCLHKASHLIAAKLVERTVVIGDLSQQQMVVQQHHEREHERKEQAKKKNRFRNRAVFNDWGLYRFVKMLNYKCQFYGKELYSKRARKPCAFTPGMNGPTLLS
jgi:putative transposase